MSRIDDVPLQAYLKGLIVDRVDFCRAGSNGESDIVLYKSTRPTRKGAPMPATKTDPTAPDVAALQKAIDDATTAAVTKALADHDAKVADYLKAEADKPEAPAELDPIEKARKEGEAVAKADMDALKAEVAKMKDEQATAVFVAKAATVSNVGPTDDIAEVLKSIAANCPDEIAAKAETLFTAAHERIAMADLTKDTGGRPAVTADSPYGLLKAAADDFRKDDPALSSEEAFAKAVRVNPGTYDEYRKSLRSSDA